mmetsp:Transcript_10589/g.36597  ORF Transcript_10589/g.36597 Transcript_10589/m.36597 type:complete len:257 (+) Transcript_10589:76-846(+)
MEDKQRRHGGEGTVAHELVGVCNVFEFESLPGTLHPLGELPLRQLEVGPRDLLLPRPVHDAGPLEVLEAAPLDQAQVLLERPRPLVLALQREAGGLQQLGGQRESPKGGLGADVAPAHHELQGPNEFGREPAGLSLRPVHAAGGQEAAKGHPQLLGSLRPGLKLGLLPASRPGLPPQRPKVHQKRVARVAVLAEAILEHQLLVSPLAVAYPDLLPRAECGGGENFDNVSVHLPPGVGAPARVVREIEAWNEAVRLK